MCAFTRPQALSRFYTIFTSADPAIAATFRNTDWDQQIHLLRHGVSASILYAAGGQIGSDELERLHKTHGKRGYRIPGWMYDAWLESLIKAIAETDSKFDTQLEARWREAMGVAIACIRDGRDLRAA